MNSRSFSDFGAFLHSKLNQAGMPFQGFPAWFCYRASVMLLCDITARKVRFSFARHKIVIDRPITHTVCCRF